MTLKVTEFPDAIWQEGSLQGDEENKKVHPDRSNLSRVIQVSVFDDLHVTASLASTKTDYAIRRFAFSEVCLKTAGKKVRTVE